ncbi:aspartic endopeptidase [Biscogniauxia marginata]|nr:aspartic endopeptidase [Biscogniauxia marginata]
MNAIYSAQSKIRKDFGLRKVKVIHNQNYQRHGTKSYVYLMKRFGFQPTKEGPFYHVERIQQRGLVPEKFKAAIGGRVQKQQVLVKKTGSGKDPAHGEVTADDQQNDSEYLCKVQIGKPVQSLMLDFDTGSADTWVRSASQSSSSQSGHNVFNPKKSNTFKELTGKTWKIQYGDGSTASGNCGADTLIVGGLSIHNQTIELATKMSKEFEQGTGDGLLGLAWSKINTVKDAGEPDPQATPVENMIKQEDIPKEAELFTSCFYSTRDAGTDDASPKESFYTFGYIDQDLVKQSGEDIHWVDVDNSEGFWSFPSASASINGQAVAATAAESAGSGSSSDNTAIADTGTTLALLSDTVVDALYKAIPGAKYDYSNQGYIFPVSTAAADLPEFRVAVGDKEFLIQKEDLAFAPTDDGKHWYGGVQSRGTLTFDILGDTFLKSCYCIWDQGNKRFGVVPKIEKTQNLTPPSDSGAGDGEKVKVFSTDMVGLDE